MVRDALVLTEHEADLAPAYADVASRHINIRADMAIQFSHEALAEAHDFIHALALGVEVGAALAATHRQAGERILEGLLERQELQHALGDRWVKPDAALVGADGVVVLHPPAALHANIVVVILPAHPERHNTIRLGDAAQDLGFVIFRFVAYEVENILRHVGDGLHQFSLTRIAPLHPCDEAIQIDMITSAHGRSPPVRASRCVAPASFPHSTSPRRGERIRNMAAAKRPQIQGCAVASKLQTPGPVGSPAQPRRSSMAATSATPCRQWTCIVSRLNSRPLAAPCQG